MNATQTIHCCWLHACKTTILFIKPSIKLGGSLWLSVILEAFNFSFSHPSQNTSRENFKIHTRSTEFFSFYFSSVLVGNWTQERFWAAGQEAHKFLESLPLFTTGLFMFSSVDICKRILSQEDVWRKESVTYLAFEHSLCTSSIGLGSPKEQDWWSQLFGLKKQGSVTVTFLIFRYRLTVCQALW